MALGVVLWDRRSALFGPIDRDLVEPLLRFGLPFMPSRVALWALNLSNRLLVAWLATRALAGVFVVAANLAQAVALLVTAFQLAWPPFAYAIRDDDEARAVYRSVLTVWLLVALAVVLPLALAREWLIAVLAGEQWRGGADAMALIALGLAFYGAYYVVGVAVGRVKRTQLNWVVTGIAAFTNVALCIVLIPAYGATGAGRHRDRLRPDGGADGPARQSRVPRRLRLGAPGRPLRAGRGPIRARRLGFPAAGRRSRGSAIAAALFVPLALSADLAVRRAAPRR